MQGRAGLAQRVDHGLVIALAELGTTCRIDDDMRASGFPAAQAIGGFHDRIEDVRAAAGSSEDGSNRLLQPRDIARVIRQHSRALAGADERDLVLAGHLLEEPTQRRAHVEHMLFHRLARIDQHRNLQRFGRCRHAQYLAGRIVFAHDEFAGRSPVTGASFLSTTLAYTVRSVAWAHTGCAGRRIAIVNINISVSERMFTSS